MLERDRACAEEFGDLAFVGGGGFGFTFRAKWFGGPGAPEVALKCFEPVGANDLVEPSSARWNPALVRSIHELGSLIAACHGCPYIAQFLALRLFPFPIIVSEWAGHETAQSLIPSASDTDDARLTAVDQEAGPRALRSSIEVGIQVGTALAHAHSHGVLHLDVKPANIVIQHDAADAVTRCKLVDFGVGRREGVAHDTRYTVVGGTPYYVSPEQTWNEQPTDRSDVYALGFTILQIALQERAVLLDRLLKTRSARKLECGLRAPTARLLACALEPSPRDRPSAAELVGALKDEYQDVAGMPWIEHPFAPPDQNRQARQLALAYLETVHEVERQSLGASLHRSGSEQTRPGSITRLEFGSRARDLERLVGAYGRKLSIAQGVDRHGLSLRLAGGLLFLALTHSYISEERNIRCATRRAHETYKILLHGDEHEELPSISPESIARLTRDHNEDWVREALARWAQAVSSALPAVDDAGRDSGAFFEAVAWLRNGLRTAEWSTKWFDNTPAFGQHEPQRLTRLSAAFVAASILIAAVALARRQSGDGLFAATRRLLGMIDLWVPSEVAREAAAVAGNAIVDMDSALHQSMLLSTHLQMLGLPQRC
jgi:serine/threonine protein kinase